MSERQSGARATAVVRREKMATTAVRPARPKTTIYREFLTLDHPYPLPEGGRGFAFSALIVCSKQQPFLSAGGQALNVGRTVGQRDECR